MAGLFARLVSVRFCSEFIFMHAQDSRALDDGLGLWILRMSHMGVRRNE